MKSAIYDYGSDKKNNTDIIYKTITCHVDVRKNDFAKISKNFAGTDLKIILMNYKNNYVGYSNRSKLFLAYFLHLAKFFDISVKSLFPCTIVYA